MRFALASVVAAFAAVVSAHTAPDYSKAPSGNAIIKPGLNQQVPVGKPFNIEWTPTTPGPISLVLLRGPSTNVKPLKTIAEQIPNDGSFTWTPSSDLEADVTHYGLMLVVQGTGQYQYSTQFGISNPGQGSNPDTTTTTATVVSTPQTTSATEEPTVTAITTVTTTECPETATSIPVSVPTGGAGGSSSSVIPSSSAKPSTMHTVPGAPSSSVPVVPSSTPSGSSPVVPPVTTPSGSSPVVPPVTTGAANRNALSMGAVVAGAVAVLAF